MSDPNDLRWLSLLHGKGAVIIVVMLGYAILFPVATSEKTKAGFAFVWNVLSGTGSIVVALLTMEKVWLSDRHEVWAGIIGIAVYAALLAWAIPFFIAYGEQPVPESPHLP